MLGNEECLCGAAWDFTKTAYLQENHSAEVYAEIQSTRYVHANFVIKMEKTFIVCVKNYNPT